MLQRSSCIANGTWGEDRNLKKYTNNPPEINYILISEIYINDTYLDCYRYKMEIIQKLWHVYFI